MRPAYDAAVVGNQSAGGISRGRCHRQPWSTRLHTYNVTGYTLLAVMAPPATRLGPNDARFLECVSTM